MTEKREIKVFGFVNGDSTDNPFSLTLKFDDESKFNNFDLGDFKRALANDPITFLHNAPSNLMTLWTAQIPDDFEGNIVIKDREIAGLGEVLQKPRPREKLSKILDEAKDLDTFYFIVEIRPYQKIPIRDISTVLKEFSIEKLKEDINVAAANFFAYTSEFLRSYVEGNVQLPETTEGITGLPRAWRRKDNSIPLSETNLLFFNLPEVSADNTTDPILERQAKRELHSLPIFGASGCGKTRLFIELLCLQWGFYFNAAQDDYGSEDLNTLIKNVNQGTKDKEKLAENSEFATAMTMILFLSRILILDHCLSIPGCEDTFNSRSWTLLQICPYIFRDVFDELFIILGTKFYMISNSNENLTLVVREKLDSLREKLTDKTYSNFAQATKLQIVIDEARVAAETSDGNFESHLPEEQARPIISPILQGFRGIGTKKKLGILYCGTGLSSYIMEWATNIEDTSEEASSTDSQIHALELATSTEGASTEASSTSSQYIEFPRWTSEALIQNYINRIKELIPDESLRKKVGKLLPKGVAEVLYEKLNGRRRPIVIAIERIIRDCKINHWREAITQIEELLTSWEQRESPGSVLLEFNRLDSKIMKNWQVFSGRSKIEETLASGYCRWFVLGHTEIINDDDMNFVQTALGPIRFENGTARVRDDPFVYKAIFVYYQKKDKYCVSYLKRMMGDTTNPSSQGFMLENIMPGLLVDAFKLKGLSSWPDIVVGQLPQELVGDVKIVGFEEGSPLACDYHRMGILQFLSAHMSRTPPRTSWAVPPFYYPSETPSGPDLVFVIEIQSQKYPVFLQLKYVKKIKARDWNHAVWTTSLDSVLEKVNAESPEIPQLQKSYKSIQSKKAKEAKKTELDNEMERVKGILKRLCRSEKYISMMIVYPFQVNISRLAKDKNFKTKRILTKVSTTNFKDIFTREHAQYFKGLKESLRIKEIS